MRKVQCEVLLVTPVEPSLAHSGCRFQVFGKVSADNLQGFCIYSAKTNVHDLGKWDHLHKLGKKLPHVRTELGKEGISVNQAVYAYHIEHAKAWEANTASKSVKVENVRCGFGKVTDPLPQSRRAPKRTDGCQEPKDTKLALAFLWH